MTQLGEQVQAQMQEQVLGQAARNICTKVNNWRNEWRTAGRRWVWELLQNAVDAAAEARRTATVSIVHRRDELVFEHQGGPFKLDDVAALITGGSAKPYDSPVTTGRFGTGFLVSHALSANVLAEGQVLSSTGVQPFRVSLHRGGTIAEILEGIVDHHRKARNSRPARAEVGCEGRVS